ncbi:hypothetical protein DEU56DRAFT_940046 [Suillus clintonianus]|uniref:uncharacterized protein n=1 Tax=Suillus clintonianus TaxID=1904413 RepID=UPI001B885367|nr:uncharacterized protein DEU56DRAFT_940046 [Suillus clintonianus]KAG2109216.1 hypothetical protein DEU56DRAFT_940046 [Suillus clintonianus]
MGIASVEAFISPIPAYTDEEDDATEHEENLTHIVGDRGLGCLLVICDDDGTALSTPDATTYIFSVTFSPTIMLLIGRFTIYSALSKANIYRILITSVLSLAGSKLSSVLLNFIGVYCFASLWISTNTVLHSHPKHCHLARLLRQRYSFVILQNVFLPSEMNQLVVPLDGADIVGNLKDSDHVLTHLTPSVHGLYRAITSTLYPWTASQRHLLSASLKSLVAIPECRLMYLQPKRTSCNADVLELLQIMVDDVSAVL